MAWFEAAAGLQGPSLCRGALPGLGLPLGRRWVSGQAENGGNGGLPASPRGLYEVLGVPQTATQAQIKTAYYKQSFLYHPDRNAGSEEAARRFTRVSEAYLVLGSVGLRKKYDRGLLSREDLRTARKPSGKEAAPASSTSALPRRKQAFAAGQPPAKPIFDFDKFYRAHYGEQLERERFLRERRREQQRRKEEAEKRWQAENLQELGVAVLFLAALALLLRLK